MVEKTKPKEKEKKKEQTKPQVGGSKKQEYKTDNYGNLVLVGGSNPYATRVDTSGSFKTGQVYTGGNQSAAATNINTIKNNIKRVEQEKQKIKEKQQRLMKIAETANAIKRKRIVEEIQNLGRDITDINSYSKYYKELFTLAAQYGIKSRNVKDIERELQMSISGENAKLYKEDIQNRLNQKISNKTAEERQSSRFQISEEEYEKILKQTPKESVKAKLQGKAYNLYGQVVKDVPRRNSMQYGPYEKDKPIYLQQGGYRKKVDRYLREKVLPFINQKIVDPNTRKMADFSARVIAGGLKTVGGTADVVTVLGRFQRDKEFRKRVFKAAYNIAKNQAEKHYSIVPEVWKQEYWKSGQHIQDMSKLNPYTIVDAGTKVVRKVGPYTVIPISMWAEAMRKDPITTTSETITTLFEPWAYSKGYRGLKTLLKTKPSPRVVKLSDNLLNKAKYVEPRYNPQIAKPLLQLEARPMILGVKRTESGGFIVEKWIKNKVRKDFYTKNEFIKRFANRDIDKYFQPRKEAISELKSLAKNLKKYTRKPKTKAAITEIQKAAKNERKRKYLLKKRGFTPTEFRKPETEGLVSVHKTESGDTIYTYHINGQYITQTKRAPLQRLSKYDIIRKRNKVNKLPLKEQDSAFKSYPSGPEEGKQLLIQKVKQEQKQITKVKTVQKEKVKTLQDLFGRQKQKNNQLQKLLGRQKTKIIQETKSAQIADTLTKQELKELQKLKALQGVKQNTSVITAAATLQDQKQKLSQVQAKAKQKLITSAKQKIDAMQKQGITNQEFKIGFPKNVFKFIKVIKEEPKVPLPEKVTKYYPSDFAKPVKAIKIHPKIERNTGKEVYEPIIIGKKGGEIKTNMYFGTEEEAMKQGMKIVDKIPEIKFKVGAGIKGRKKLSLLSREKIPTKKFSYRKGVFTEKPKYRKDNKGEIFPLIRNAGMRVTA